jgi:aminoglycoside phosphotransferase (APT) family kinase protein
MIDQPTQVRPGEDLDKGQLTSYLKEKLGNQTELLEVRQFPSGFSNLTYLLRTHDQEYVLRRPPFGANIKSAHDMGREYRVLEALAGVYTKIPRPILFCEDASMIGSPFYLMERVQGVILRNQLPEGIKMTANDWQQLSEAAIDQLATLHRIDIQQTGLEELGKPNGYVERQISGWIERYRKAETDYILAMNFLADWLPDHQPPSSPTAFIHNDYKYDNLVLNPRQITNILAVLDWEMATVGDPFMDLGTTLGYWAEPADPKPLRQFGLTSQPGNLNRAQLWERYIQKTGLQTEHSVFYFAFASFKIGVIAQQIYARFKQGYTQDPRFAGLIYVVQACAENGQQAVKQQKISGLY